MFRRMTQSVLGPVLVPALALALVGSFTGRTVAQQDTVKYLNQATANSENQR